MIYKPLALLLMLALLTEVNSSSAQDEGPCAVLESIKEAIVAADIGTATCQMTTGWHFPCSFYNHIQKAQEYCAYRKNGKMTKKTLNSLQGLSEAVQEAIEGIEGFWSGDLSELWIDPVPAAPDCAQEALGLLKSEIENLMSQIE